APPQPSSSGSAWPSPHTGLPDRRARSLIAGQARNMGLALLDGVRVAGKDAVELATGADAELGEDLAQVVLDCARADEQPGADVLVGQAPARQPRDLALLRGQRIAGRADGLRGALAYCLAGGQQLTAGAFGESAGSHRLEHLVGGAELLACVRAAV